MLKARVKFLMENEEDPTASSVEAAYRYLVKSYEILECIHGTVHPSIGACLLQHDSCVTFDFSSSSRYASPSIKALLVSQWHLYKTPLGNSTTLVSG